MSIKLVLAGRGGGKTTMAIDILRQNPQAVLCVLHHREQDRLRKLYPAQSQQILTHADLFSSRSFDVLRGRDHHQVEILIDDVDQLLRQLVGPYRLTLLTSSYLQPIMLRPQVIDRPHRNESGQRHMFPPTSLDAVGTTGGKASVEVQQARPRRLTEELGIEPIDPKARE